MNRFFSKIAGAVIAIALCFSANAPASAALTPTITVGFIGAGQPGQGRIVGGTVTFGASDTYVAGGFTITPAALGCSVSVTSINYNSPAATFDVVATFSAGIATIKFATIMNGTSNMTATQTTKTVTIPTGFTSNDVLGVNTPILVSLDDAAVGGGGTGTWAVTNAVSTVKQASSTTFTVTAIAAAPTNGGNFVWQIPTLNMELAAATAVGSLVMPFTATCV